MAKTESAPSLASAIQNKRLCFEKNANARGSTKGKPGSTTAVKMIMHAQFGSDGTVHMGPYMEGKAFDAAKGTYKVDGLTVNISMNGQEEGSLTFSRAKLAKGDTFDVKELGEVTIYRIEKAGPLTPFR